MHLGEPHCARAARAEGKASGGGEHPGGINKGHQDGWKAKMHGNQRGRECRRGGNWGGTGGARLTAPDIVSAILQQEVIA